MKKKYLFRCFTLFLFLFLGVANISAQMVRFGVKGGVDVIDNSINDAILDSHNRLGFQVGGIIHVSTPVLGLGVESGLIYGFQKFEEISGANSNSSKYIYDNYKYMKLPISIKQHFSLIPKLGIFVSAGSYAIFKLNGGKLREDSLNEVGTQYDSRTFGVGVNAGSGIRLFDNLELGIYYRKQLTSNYSVTPPTTSGAYRGLIDKPSNWSIKLTYFIN